MQIHVNVQAVSISLCVTGFGESMREVMGGGDIWVERGIAGGALLTLAIINMAGVKWVIKLQFLLLLLIGTALLDFITGTFIPHNIGKYTLILLIPK